MRTPGAAYLSVVIFATIPMVGDAGRAEDSESLPGAASFARLALECVHQEYPNKIAHVMNSDADAAPPRQLTPAFYGCFDWHSSVHGHWLLARLARLNPDAPFSGEARAALARSLTAENISAEVDYVTAPGRASFERPYGLAWLLQLAAELRQWDDPQARIWAQNLEPLETAASGMISSWLPKLGYAIRTGEHSQTAFAFGLILDWARIVGKPELTSLVIATSNRLYLDDRGCPLGFEPSGQDFLSPCIAEADLMRRILDPTAYAAWIGGFLPDIPFGDSADWLPIGIVTDRSDGKLAHLDGLNLSRAWMLEGIASGLPSDDPRIAALQAAADAHARSGLSSVTGEHYEGGHWLGTFATYLTTKRGIDDK